MRAKSMIIALGTVLALAGCASTQTLYGPVLDTGGYQTGYSDFRIEDNRWRVTFRAGPDGDESLAEQFALRRAAELSAQAGYDWFEIVQRDTETEGYQDSPVGVHGSAGTSFGSRGYSASGVGIGISINRAAERRYITRMEIIAGHGERPHIRAYLVDEVLARYHGPQI